MKHNTRKNRHNEKQTESRLYHRKVYFPPIVGYMGKVEYNCLNWNSHAIRESDKDNRGYIQPFSSITIDFDSDVFEVEINNGNIVKFCARVQYDDSHDVIIVITGDRFNPIVKTVWLNDKNDSHKTLDRSKYCTE